MATPDPASTTPFGEDVVPYQLHVSSKYLKLTEEKLELTRLPRESSEPKPNVWWEPKPEIEALVDFWLEEYSWRDEEDRLNAAVPQFRTQVLVPGSGSSVRIHFIHVRSPHSNAVPLLLIPPFPFANLNLTHLIPSFTNPDDASTQQPFHLVIPSFPGLGFSDALPSNTPVISATAEAFDTVMRRLGYKQYVASNTSVTSNSPSEIDWKLANNLAHNFTDSCLGVHLISPPLEPPRAQDALINWIRWKLSSITGRPRLGYTSEDISAFQKAKSTGRKSPNLQSIDFDIDKFRDPNVLSYALCDSPVGLLIFVLMMLKLLGSTKELSPRTIITLAELIWLPGPEGTLRYWANCISSGADEEKPKKPSARKPRVGITVFVGMNQAAAPPVVDQGHLKPAERSYACPGWASARYEVVSTFRVFSKPKLVAWDCPEVILDGTRSMIKVILAQDKRMLRSSQPGGQLPRPGVSGGELGVSGTTAQASSGADISSTANKSPTPPQGEAQGKSLPVV
ncbi:unnamed protein product [Clonostachys rosea f. rosea IK726]|uniref:Uncharacterized protein n=1 Tax=Clonostachys rosea f. rosea IK726 TaxID=1349383 RepID=A0ACA9ULV8_BIOOC|nr:unnamed protein product [Clonostachys rosea f. rosea IK726]